eukprot:m.79912 g.79912  ORF g.79912 m.79912 type:complete len:399 (-) comp14529_c0_seq9:2058-3254(-)
MATSTGFDLASLQPHHHLGVFFMADASLERASDAIQALPNAAVEKIVPTSPGHNLVYVSNFDPVHCAQTYGAFADRICRFGGYYELQHAATSRAALEEGLRRIMQTEQPSSCRLYASPITLRRQLLATLPDQPDFTCLQPHNAKHMLCVFQAGENLYLYGYMPIQHTLLWFDDPGAFLKATASSRDSAIPSTDHASAASPVLAPSEQPPRPLRSGGNSNEHMVYNQAPRVCRAAIKLREVFDGRLKPFLLPKDCTAVDVGAAPGGWTDYLADKCKHVVAVDPGALAQDVLNRPNVTHLASKVQECLSELQARGPYGLLVCDMNTFHFDAIEALKPAINLMVPGARLIFTIKLGSKTAAAAERAETSVTEALSPYFQVDEVVWLFANRRRERTVLATRK